MCARRPHKDAATWQRPHSKDGPVNQRTEVIVGCLRHTQREKGNLFQRSPSSFIFDIRQNVEIETEPGKRYEYDITPKNT